MRGFSGETLKRVKKKEKRVQENGIRRLTLNLKFWQIAVIREEINRKVVPQVRNTKKRKC